MRADYKMGDIIYSTINQRVFGVKIEYGKTPLKVLEVKKHNDGYSYVVEIADRNGNIREWDSIPDIHVITPDGMRLNREQDAKIADIMGYNKKEI